MILHLKSQRVQPNKFVMEMLKIILITGLSLMIILSGIFKLTKNKKIVEGITMMGVGKYIPFPGVAEIVFAGLFFYPPTHNIGFILLTCYFSWALATGLSHKNIIIAPLVFLVLLFSAAYINNRALFF